MGLDDCIITFSITNAPPPTTPPSSPATAPLNLPRFGMLKDNNRPISMPAIPQQAGLNTFSRKESFCTGKEKNACAMAPDTNPQRAPFHSPLTTTHKEIGGRRAYASLAPRIAVVMPMHQRSPQKPVYNTRAINVCCPLASWFMITSDTRSPIAPPTNPAIVNNMSLLPTRAAGKTPTALVGVTFSGGRETGGVVVPSAVLGERRSAGGGWRAGGGGMGNAIFAKAGTCVIGSQLVLSCDIWQSELT